MDRVSVTMRGRRHDLRLQLALTRHSAPQQTTAVGTTSGERVRRRRGEGSSVGIGE